MGLFALGGIDLGVWTFGALALGWQAYGACAIAWKSAVGGIALAREFALGGIAHAAQANNVAARTFVDSSSFFRLAHALGHYSLGLYLLWVVPLVLQWRIVSRACSRRERGVL